MGRGWYRSLEPGPYPGSVINFFSDLGPGGEGVGVVHGVIARIAPEVRVIDVSHDLETGNVRAAAMVITRAIQYLPDGVVLAATLSGPWTQVRPIAALTPIGVVIGPDNGLLSPAVAMVGGASEIVAIDNPEFVIPSAGATQPLRDVLAPAAAVVASAQARFEDLGSRVEPGSVQPLLLPLPESGDGRVVGEVWWVNPHGHLQTNIGPTEIEMAGLRPGEPGFLRVGASEYSITWVENEMVTETDAFIYVDDFGLVAVGVDGADSEESLRLSPGTALTLGAAGPRPTKL